MTMNFYFAPSTKSNSIFIKRAQSLNAQLISPTVNEDDKNKVFRKSTFLSLKQEGLTSLLVPKSWGGQEEVSSTYYSVLRELGKVSASYSITVGIHQMIQSALLTFGSEDQKTRFLPGLVSGDLLGAFSLSESHSGSDAASLKTTAKKTSQGYIIDGTKLWCSNGADADLFLVMVRTGQEGSKGISAFLIPRQLEGFSIGKREVKLGLNQSSLTELIFERCLVPPSLLLGHEGEGFKIALSQLDSGRLGIAATGLGLAQASMEFVFQSRDEQGDLLISEGTQTEWASYFAQLQATLALIDLVAELRDQGEVITPLASQCKLLATDLAMQMTSQAVTDLGWNGVLCSKGVERLMRDAKALQIVEGTNQIQKLVISRELDRIGRSCK